MIFNKRVTSRDLSEYASDAVAGHAAIAAAVAAHAQAAADRRDELAAATAAQNAQDAGPGSAPA